MPKLIGYSDLNADELSKLVEAIAEVAEKFGFKAYDFANGWTIMPIPGGTPNINGQDVMPFMFLLEKN